MHMITRFLVVFVAIFAIAGCKKKSTSPNNSDADVYVAGMADNHKPVYWKNGVMVQFQKVLMTGAGQMILPLAAMIYMW
jgi:uncharacterized lipoprotein YajG